MSRSISDPRNVKSANVKTGAKSQGEVASTETETSLAEPDHEAFLHRWSRRKAAVRQAKSSLPATALDTEPSLVLPEPIDAPAAPVLSDDDMPVLESLDETSDYSMFLSTGVSDALRGRALRKLFGFSMFNVRDGLDDYDDDYRTFDALGDIVTADMKLQAERRAQQVLLDGDGTDTEARSAPASGDGDAGEHDAKSPPCGLDDFVADGQASSPILSAADARAPGEDT